MSDEVFEKYGQRIIFAIAVNEIECRLLPLHYDDKKLSARENNCVHHLNSRLSRNNENTINPNDKQSRIYKNISNDFRKAKIFKNAYPQNPSLKIFVEELISKVQIIDTSIND